MENKMCRNKQKKLVNTHSYLKKQIVLKGEWTCVFNHKQDTHIHYEQISVTDTFPGKFFLWNIHFFFIKIHSSNFFYQLLLIRFFNILQCWHKYQWNCLRAEYSFIGYSWIWQWSIPLRYRTYTLNSLFYAEYLIPRFCCFVSNRENKITIAIFWL